MKFSISLWKFTITLRVLDANPADKDLAVSLSISWK